MGKRLFPEDKAWQTHPFNIALLGFLLVVIAAILALFTSYTNNLDEIKPTLQFMLLPLGGLGFFFILYRGYAAPIPPRIWIPLAAFAAVSVVSSFVAFKAWRAWFTDGWYYTVFVGFFIVTACIKSEEAFRRVVTIYVGICLAVILFGLFHYFGGCSILMTAFFPLGPIGRSRIYDLLYTLAQNHEMFSTILNTDFYAAFLVIIFPLAVNLFMAPFRTWWEPVLGFTTAFLAGISIILARSNDAWGVTFLIVIFYFVMSITIGHVLAKKPDVMWTMVIGLALFLVVIVFMLWWWMEPTFKMVGYALRSRSLLFQCAIDTFRESPKNMILGAGPGNYLVCAPFHLGDNYFENGIANVNLYAHNQYLDVLCEQGLLGLFCYLTFLGTMVWMGFRQILRPGSQYLRIQQIGLMAGIIGCLIQDLVSPNMRWTVCGVNHWFQFGLAISCAMLGMRHDDLAARAAAAGEAVPDDRKAPSDPVFLRSPLGRVSPLWNRRVGLTGMIVSGVIAIILLVFGYCYFASAYWNNEGIIAINTAGQSTGSRRNISYQDSIEDFQKAIKWWPGFITSYYKMAHAYSMLEQYDMAVKAYDDLEKYAPGYSETWFNYGIVYGVLANKSQNPGKRAEYIRLSLKRFEDALRMAKKIQVQTSVAQAYQIAAAQTPNVSDEDRRKWLMRSLEILYQCAMRKYPLDEDRQMHQDLRLRVAQRYLWTAANQAATEKNEELRKRYMEWTADVCTKIVDEDKNHDDAIVGLKAEALTRLGRTEEALAFIKKELEDNPISISLNRILGKQYADAKQHAEASRQYEFLSRLIDATQKTTSSLASSTAPLQAFKNEINHQTALLSLLKAADEAQASSDTARAKKIYELISSTSPGSFEAGMAKANLTKMLSGGTSTTSTLVKPALPGATKPPSPNAVKPATMGTDKPTTPSGLEKPKGR